MGSLGPFGQLLPPWPSLLVPCHCYCIGNDTAWALEHGRRASLRLLGTHMTLPSPLELGESPPAPNHLPRGTISTNVNSDYVLPCLSPVMASHCPQDRGQVLQPGIPCESCSPPPHAYAFCATCPSTPASHDPWLYTVHTITPLSLCTCSSFCLQCSPTSVST